MPTPTFTRTLTVLLALLVPGAANGQVQRTATLTAPYAPVNMAAVTAFGYYMSPYTGTIDGTVQRFNCVDFFHDVWLGDVWQVNEVNLGAASSNLALLATTRDGASPNLATFGGSVNTVLNVYRQMAWLTDQQPVNPGATATSRLQTTAIQTAIWAIGSPGYAASERWGVNSAHQYVRLTAAQLAATSSDPLTTAYWIDQATSSALAPSLVNSSYYHRFNVITNINMSAVHGAQEFIYALPPGAVEFNEVVATPEPGTIILVGTGLIGMLGVAGRNRRRSPGGALESETS